MPQFDDVEVRVGTLSESSVAATPFTVDIEAETGQLSEPMALFRDPDAPEFEYIATTTSEQGAGTFEFTVPADAEVMVWCRVRTVAGSADSFYVTLDGEPSTRDIYDAAEEESSDAWQWTSLCGRGGVTNGYDLAFSVAPRIFQLAAGEHTLTFEGRELGTRLDALVITSDPDFDPVTAKLSTVAPSVALRASTIPGEFELEWSAVPGRRYQVYYQDNLADPEWTPLPGLVQASTTRAIVTVPVTAGIVQRYFSVVLVP